MGSGSRILFLFQKQTYGCWSNHASVSWRWAGLLSGENLGSAEVLKELSLHYHLLEAAQDQGMALIATSDKPKETKWAAVRCSNLF